MHKAHISLKGHIYCKSI